MARKSVGLNPPLGAIFPISITLHNIQPYHPQQKSVSSSTYSLPPADLPAVDLNERVDSQRLVIPNIAQAICFVRTRVGHQWPESDHLPVSVAKVTLRNHHQDILGITHSPLCK